jgi:tol-pal system protein YbgF
LNGAGLRSAVALGAFLLLCGCVTPQEFHVLRSDVDKLKRGAGAEPAADEWGGKSASGNRVAELGAEVEALRDEVSRLQGELSALKQEVDRTRGGQPAAGGAPAAGGTDVAAVQPAPGTEGAVPGGTEAAPAEEVRDYEEAFRRYRSGDYAGAVDRFQVFLQTHPSSAYADNALFWMGESYFKLNDFEQAAVAFDKVVKRFPDGNKVPDALYRQGVALIEIGNRTKQQKTYGPAACQIFRRIADEYPNSDRVSEARRQLEKCPS